MIFQVSSRPKSLTLPCEFSESLYRHSQARSWSGIQVRGNLGLKRTPGNIKHSAQAAQGCLWSMQRVLRYWPHLPRRTLHQSHIIHIMLIPRPQDPLRVLTRPEVSMLSDLHSAQFPHKRPIQMTSNKYSFYMLLYVFMPFYAVVWCCMMLYAGGHLEVLWSLSTALLPEWALNFPTTGADCVMISFAVGTLFCCGSNASCLGIAQRTSCSLGVAVFAAGIYACTFSFTRRLLRQFCIELCRGRFCSRSKPKWPG